MILNNLRHNIKSVLQSNSVIDIKLNQTRNPAKRHTPAYSSLIYVLIQCHYFLLTRFKHLNLLFLTDLKELYRNKRILTLT